MGRGASPGAESGAVVETTAPSLDQVGEAGTASPARLVSLASATARKRRCMVSCCGVMMWYGSQGLLLACRLPVARVSAAGAQHAAPASLHDLQGSRRSEPALGGRAPKSQNKTKAVEAKGILDEAKTGTLKAFDWYLDRLLTPTGRLNRHILGEPPPPDPGFRLPLGKVQHHNIKQQPSQSHSLCATVRVTWPHQPSQQ